LQANWFSSRLIDEKVMGEEKMRRDGLDKMGERENEEEMHSSGRR